MSTTSQKPLEPLSLKPKGNVLSRRSFLQYTAQAGLAAGLHFAAGCTPRGIGRGDRPNIVLISVDTTRADHLSCYGHSRTTSRNLDALAEESVLCTNAISTSSWTLPAHASMFTGMFVTSHGARKFVHGEHTLQGEFQYGGDGIYRVRSISEDQELLAEILSRAGYSTGSVVAGPWLKKNFGLARGFDYHDDEGILGMQGTQKKIAPVVTRNAIRWLTSLDGHPFFLFLNYFDPHKPYIFTRDTKNLFLQGQEQWSKEEKTRRDYDVQIFIMDHGIGKLIDFLKKSGLYDNTMIMVVGDHGELLYEHDLFGHGMYLYQETLHVPFFFKYPHGEVQHRTHEGQTQVIDVIPLIFERLNLPIPEFVQGRTLADSERTIFAEVYPHEEESEAGHWQAVFQEQHKFLLNSKGNHQLFNLEADPRETTNLYEKEPDRARQMKRKLQTFLSELPRPEGAPVSLKFDDQTHEELESLGYLQ